MFQKKIVKKIKYFVFVCIFKGLQMVELKKDEKNDVIPTNNALKWFIKKQITKCRKSCLGYLCSVSTYPFVIFPRRNSIGHSKFGRIQQGIGHRNIHFIYIAVVSLDQLVPSIGIAYRRNGRCPLKLETYPPKLKI